MNVMLFKETALQGAFIIELEAAKDDRGLFARTFCEREFKAQGLNACFVQCSLSVNARRGTLRGMHYQAKPHAETKLVHCVRGALYDVIIDLRPQSATYCRWVGVELRAANNTLLYVPEGFAHGFQTLEDDTAVYYQISTYYAPQSARRVRWNDPAFAITWPLSDLLISDRDSGLPDYKR